MENTIDSVITQLKRTGFEVYIVLDGLDEYPARARQGLQGARTVPGRDAVLKWLHRFREKHENARVLVASRKENDIQEFRGEVIALDVAEEITEDVDMFIECSIQRIIKDGEWKASFEDDMREKMKGASEK